MAERTKFLKDNQIKFVAGSNKSGSCRRGQSTYEYHYEFGIKVISHKRGKNQETPLDLQEREQAQLTTRNEDCLC